MFERRKVISLCLAVTFMSYYASVALFPHTHIISGASISHSHTHTNSHHDTNSGGHTEQSITLIAQISHFEHSGFSCSDVPTTPQFSLCENKIFETTQAVVSTYLENLSLRAPPIV